MISSLLDTDLYKLTMMQYVYNCFPATLVEYAFCCRSHDVSLGFLADDVHFQLQKLCKLNFSHDELLYLKKLGYFSDDFLSYLKNFRLDMKYVAITRSNTGQLEINIKGPWLETILFEVPLLALINESYFRTLTHGSLAKGRERLQQKIQKLKKLEPSFKFVDFGTRRRFSKNWQLEIDRTLKEQLPLNFAGTSNVWLAKECQIPPTGTMAHELLQAGQVLAPYLEDCQNFILKNWHQQYEGKLSIALSDILGVDAFLYDFDKTLANQYMGVRHDSGDPFSFGDKVILHYQKFQIDPMQKIIVFSDGLTIEKACKIYNYFKNRIQTVFGIGTNLTNDVGFKPINIVIKMIRCNGKPVAKLSDEPAKSICLDHHFMAVLKSVKEKKTYQLSLS